MGATKRQAGADERSFGIEAQGQRGDSLLGPGGLALGEEVEHPSLRPELVDVVGAQGLGGLDLDALDGVTRSRPRQAVDPRARERRLPERADPTSRSRRAVRADQHRARLGHGHRRGLGHELHDRGWSAVGERHAEIVDQGRGVDAVEGDLRVILLEGAGVYRRRGHDLAAVELSTNIERRLIGPHPHHGHLAVEGKELLAGLEEQGLGQVEDPGLHPERTLRVDVSIPRPDDSDTASVTFCQTRQLRLGRTNHLLPPDVRRGSAV